MERQCCGSVNLTSEDEEDFRLNYYMLQSMKQCEDLRKNITVYGIEIEKEKFGERIESSVIEDFTVDEKYNSEVVELLIKNTVTPVHLKNIIEDLL